MHSATPRLRSRSNPWLQLGDGDTVLTYALRTDPSPLTVSLPGLPASLEAIELVITNQTANTVSVNAIGLTLQFGADASDLAGTTDGIAGSVSDTVNWSVTPPSQTVTSGPALWVVASPTGDPVDLAAGASLVVDLLKIPVNTAIGTTTLGIAEKLADGTNGQTTWEITKFPAGFYFGGLVANVKEGSKAVPVAQVPNGTSVTLTWNGSVTDASAYTVLVSTNGGQQPCKVITAGQWTSDGVVSDTVFVVKVKVTGDGGEELSFALATSVAVQQPDLVANSVSVTTTLGVGGAATFSGGASVPGTLSAGTVSASSLSATGNVQGASAGVTGLATVGSLNAGSANVSGALSAGGLTVNGAATLAGATLSGLLQANGAVGMLGTPQSIPGGKSCQSAPTDGYLLGSVGSPSDTGKVSVGWVGASSNGATAQATGGNVCFMYREDGSKRSWWYGNNPQSFILPVKKGAAFSTWINFPNGNEQNPPVSLYWIPVGAGAVSALQLVDDSGPLPPGLHPPQALYGTSEDTYTHGPAIDRVVDVLSDILGDAMSGGQRARLERAVRDLVYLEARDVRQG